MNIAEVYKTHPERYFAWIYERQAVWYRRYILKVPRPWTTDPIIDRFRFTNSYRELDRGTLYALQRILFVENDTLHNLFMRVLTYRVFNKVGTYHRIFEPTGYFTSVLSRPNWDTLRQELKQLHTHEPVFTNAHVVATFGARKEAETTKIDKVIDWLSEVSKHQDHAEEILRKPGLDMAASHKRLMEIEHVGDFIAFEVLSDIAYTEMVQWDEDSWANAGPGAREGLDLVMPGPGTNLEKMRKLQSDQDLYLHSLGLPLWLVAGPKVHQARLSLRNIEGGLCEYYKYNKCLEGGVRMSYSLGQGYIW